MPSNSCFHILLFLVSCNNNKDVLSLTSWKFNHSKLENHQGYLKSNDTINLSINKIKQHPNGNNSQEFLRSHDVQFTIGNDNFQEVVCHNERLGGNDEVSCFIFSIYIFSYSCINIKLFFVLVVH